MSEEVKGTRGMIRENPNEVVMTANTRVVPYRRDATKDELRDFAMELKEKKDRTAKAIARKNKELKEKANKEEVDKK